MTNLETSPTGLLMEWAAVADRTPPSIVLEHRIVRYESTPDRCTIFPADCSPENQLTTWLSADQSAFVDLESVR